jgi:class 3 adenylate cyclase
MRPTTQYALSGDVHIAYQVFGDGPLNLVVIMGAASHLELEWEEPSIEHFLNELASFARVAMFDKRGTGMSDRVPDSALPGLEQRMDDVRAVMDAAAMERAAIFGMSEGSAMSLLFAATYPQRTDALIIYGGFAKRLWSPDYPWGQAIEARQKMFKDIEAYWGRSIIPGDLPPELENQPHVVERYLRYQRMSASPGAMLTFARMNAQVDVRDALSSVHVPVLILHHVGDPDVSIGGARYIAQQVPHAKLIELPGNHHILAGKEAEGILAEIQEFLTGVRPVGQPDRVLATVLFTDIVRSTERASQLGDRQWKELLESHHVIVRKELTRFHGKEIDTAGDGFLATFDGPARAVRCALAICNAVKEIGLEIRAGIHTGEVELMGNHIRGIAVHIGSRVMSKAGASEIWVSSTVKDLTVGSGLQFEDRGMHALKGIPEEWHLYAAKG